MPYGFSPYSTVPYSTLQSSGAVISMAVAVSGTASPAASLAVTRRFIDGATGLASLADYIAIKRALGVSVSGYSSAASYFAAKRSYADSASARAAVTDYMAATRPLSDAVSAAAQATEAVVLKLAYKDSVAAGGLATVALAAKRGYADSTAGLASVVDTGAVRRGFADSALGASSVASQFAFNKRAFVDAAIGVGSSTISAERLAAFADTCAGAASEVANFKVGRPVSDSVLSAATVSDAAAVLCSFIAQVLAEAAMAEGFDVARNYKGAVTGFASLAESPNLRRSMVAALSPTAIAAPSFVFETRVFAESLAAACSVVAAMVYSVDAYVSVQGSASSSAVLSSKKAFADVVIAYAAVVDSFSATKRAGALAATGSASVLPSFTSVEAFAAAHACAASLLAGFGRNTHVASSWLVSASLVSSAARLAVFVESLSGEAVSSVSDSVKRSLNITLAVHSAAQQNLSAERAFTDSVAAYCALTLLGTTAKYFADSVAARATCNLADIMVGAFLCGVYSPASAAPSAVKRSVMSDVMLGRSNVYSDYSAERALASVLAGAAEQNAIPHYYRSFEYSVRGLSAVADACIVARHFATGFQPKTLTDWSINLKITTASSVAAPAVSNFSASRRSTFESNVTSAAFCMLILYFRGVQPLPVLVDSFASLLQSAPVGLAMATLLQALPVSFSVVTDDAQIQPPPDVADVQITEVQPAPSNFVVLLKTASQPSPVSSVIAGPAAQPFPSGVQIA